MVIKGRVSLSTREFAREADAIFKLRLANRINTLGGYGPGDEVIYNDHPFGCPAVLVDKRGPGTAAFVSNGSLDFKVKHECGFETTVLRGSFDPIEKTCVGPLSHNLWLDCGRGGTFSLVNPSVAWGGVKVRKTRIVKIPGAERSMWICHSFTAGDIKIRAALKLFLVMTENGPALVRRLHLLNDGNNAFTAKLWSLFNLRGTQELAFNKSVWYDMGLPLNARETVVSCAVPYRDLVQIKRLSQKFTASIKPVDRTCDYQTFIGDTSEFSLIPAAVKSGKMLDAGAKDKWNRFSSPTIAAHQYALSLSPGHSAVLDQSLLYITDDGLMNNFRDTSRAVIPSYVEMAKSFRDAARELVSLTSGVANTIDSAAKTRSAAAKPSRFHLEMPGDPVAAKYANSVWNTMDELYENCRAHGAKLADGIEIGTRDRGQDMWPMLKENPGRVRDDLIHALSFMYRTIDDPHHFSAPMTLREKLHGMFPRQFPSRWLNREHEVFNDNRPYADSALWLVDSLIFYMRETGDNSILWEVVPSIHLTDPDTPITSGIRGAERRYQIIEVALEIFAGYQRLCDDSPYGMVQILYGEWCDPVDMFGTGIVGDPETRGHGTGVNARLSAQLVRTLAMTVDALSTPSVRKQASKRLRLDNRLGELKIMANQLRKAVMRHAWEEIDGNCGFIDSLHHLTTNGSRPNYAAGETGYTLGSMRHFKEFDGLPRRALSSCVWGLAMMLLERPYLDPIPDRDTKVAGLLNTIDAESYDPLLGLKLYTTPIANDREARRLVGRMGIIPSGCSENGEYHHAQLMAHYFRLLVPGQAETVWRQFKPVMSASRDESLCGPFDTPCCSYAADKDDPHFGKGMYFGLSGSMDWIIEFFHRLAGLKLDLNNPSKPDLVIEPALPPTLAADGLTLKRVVFQWLGSQGYREIPLSVSISSGKRFSATVNGKPVAAVEINNLSDYDELDIIIRLKA